MKNIGRWTRWGKGVGVGMKRDGGGVEGEVEVGGREQHSERGEVGQFSYFGRQLLQIVLLELYYSVIRRPSNIKRILS